MLYEWEDEHGPYGDHIPDSLHDEDDAVTNLIPFPCKPRGLILPVEIEVESKTYRVPHLYWEDGLDEWVCAYLRHYIVKNHRSYSSAEQLAVKLRRFRAFQRANSVETKYVTEMFLIAWMQTLEATCQVDRRNDYIRSVHGFFVWAEINGRLRHHVQLGPKPQYASYLGDEYVFPIPSTEVVVEQRGAKYSKWVSTLIDNSGHSNEGSRHTPTSEEIERLIQEVWSHGRNAVRNNLIISWALETGARVSELLQLKVSDFPPLEKAGEILSEEFTYIVVNRKNRGAAKLRVPRMLIARTLEYVYGDPERSAIVAEYGESWDVFLSEKGGVLTSDSVTRICGEFFAKAGIANANIHRLRARFITDIIEGVLDDLEAKGQHVDFASDWSSSILSMAKNLMGHGHVMSLAPYLNEIRVRRITPDGKILPRKAKGHEERDTFGKQLHEQVKHNVIVAEAERLKALGNFREAAAKYREAADQLQSA
jgi:integrase